MGYHIQTVFISCLAVAGAIRAQDDWADGRDSFICRSSTEVREIKTYVSNAPHTASKEDLSCRVDYVKDGRTQTVWTSHTNRSFCDSKASDLAAKLEQSNFSCKPLHAR
jgi:hypothetical protein